MNHWIILAHAGAWDIPPSLHDCHLEGLKGALDAGKKVLEKGMGALEAAIEVVRFLEDYPGINAGRGSAKTLRDEVEMDASIMEGEHMNIGAVAHIRHVEHPIQLAYQVLTRSPHTLLVGEGAEEKALLWGLPFKPNSYFKEPFEPAGGDTVGCLIRDSQGHLVCASSTGGTANKWPGRVGDTPLPGCGYYVDDRIGGVVCSGEGEAIMRSLLAARAFFLMSQGLSAKKAAEEALRILESISPGEAGLLTLTKDGAWGWAYNTPHFPRGIIEAGDKEPRLWL